MCARRIRVDSASGARLQVMDTCVVVSPIVRPRRLLLHLAVIRASRVRASDVKCASEAGMDSFVGTTLDAIGRRLRRDGNAIRARRIRVGSARSARRAGMDGGWGSRRMFVGMMRRAIRRRRSRLIIDDERVLDESDV